MHPKGSVYFLFFFKKYLTTILDRSNKKEQREREWDSSQLHHSATQWPAEDMHNGSRLMDGVILKSKESLQREEECLSKEAGCFVPRHNNDLKKKNVVLTTCLDTK